MLNAISLPQSCLPLTVSGALGCEAQIHRYKRPAVCLLSAHVWEKRWCGHEEMVQSQGSCVFFSQLRFVAWNFA